VPHLSARGQDKAKPAWCTRNGASALFVSLVEFACGGALTVGLLTPLCALMLMGDMIVAILTNRIGSIHVRAFTL
jgi:uncharacterized membrane protein YphA (DoxX/SURF4 family)